MVYKLREPVKIGWMCEKCFFKELEICGIILPSEKKSTGKRSVRKLRKDNKR